MSLLRVVLSLSALSAGLGLRAVNQTGLANDAAGRHPLAMAPAARADTGERLDPIARLEARIQSGEVVLAYDSAYGYLPAVLKALNIPVSSQGLVFSRTSLQTDKITPWSPRALYFNDDVYIGFVQESAFLEVAAVDPNKGGVFYTFNQTKRDKPKFTRETTMCLMCHGSKAATGGVPGFMVLSTIADRHGYAITGVHDGPTTDATPIKQRFGGYYVTGSAGARGHSGNVYVPMLGSEVFDKPAFKAQTDLTTESERTDLTGKFELSPYLTPNSDIVSLMVLVHQANVHNLITLTHDAATEAVRYESIYKSSEAPPSTDGYPPGSMQKVHGLVERLLRAMLFVNEAPFVAPMKGNTTFTQDFAAMGPRDKQGRSLRDFELQRRMFKYPMSFLIYSDAFDALPTIARTAFYTRLYAILKGDDPDLEFQRMSEPDRKAVLEILEATKPDFVKLRGK